MSSAITIQGVTKSFGHHIAVDNLDLRVPAGEIFGFIGPNGSGKTTTIRMILRIIQPDCGTIDVLGKSKGDSADDRIGYLPEERGLYRKMKAKDLLHFFGRLKGGTDLKEKIDTWLTRLELAEWGDKPLDTFSKGMAQKIQFIAAIVADPQLVILDEPFSGLDPLNAETLKREVLRLRDEGKTIIFSTHDMAVAETLCDSIFMIHKGHKVLEGPVKAIKENHATNTVYLQADCAESALQELPHVEKVVRTDGEWCIGLDKATSPQQFLRDTCNKNKHSEICSWRHIATRDLPCKSGVRPMSKARYDCQT